MTETHCDVVDLIFVLPAWMQGGYFLVKQGFIGLWLGLRHSFTEVN